MALLDIEKIVAELDEDQERIMAEIRPFFGDCVIIGDEETKWEKVER